MAARAHQSKKTKTCLKYVQAFVQANQVSFIIILAHQYLAKISDKLCVYILYISSLVTDRVCAQNMRFDLGFLEVLWRNGFLKQV